MKYVGPSRLQQIATYADSKGFVPSGNQPLGTWEGVSFTAAEADATLNLANTASYELLDVDVALDSRAVDAIVADRPIETILELSERYFVGGSALTKLKNYAVQNTGLPAGADCAVSSDCTPGLVCEGIPYDGSPEIGKCIDPAFISGEGDTCSQSQACNEGLACVGLSLYDEGYCNPAWMVGNFDHQGAMTIPDNDPNGITAPSWSTASPAFPRTSSSRSTSTTRVRRTWSYVSSAPTAASRRCGTTMRTRPATSPRPGASSATTS